MLTEEYTKLEPNTHVIPFSEISKENTPSFIEKIRIKNDMELKENHNYANRITNQTLNEIELIVEVFKK